MQRRKNRRYLIEKEKPEEDSKFIKQIKELSEDLFYISETDAEIRPFVGKKAEAVTGEEILSQLGKVKEKPPIEEGEFFELFGQLTEIQDWFGDEEKETAEKFKKLKDYLEKNLKDIKVFKIGKIEIDLYVVGLGAGGKLMGIQTKAVET